MSATRDQKFGRIIAIANVLGEKVLPPGHQGIAAKYLSKIDKAPRTVFLQIHRELMNHSHRLGASEMALMDMLGEQIAELSMDELTNQPLSMDGSWIINYYHKSHELNNIMGAEEAGEKWGLSPAYVRNLCKEGVVAAKRIGMAWVIPKDHPNPKKYSAERSEDR